MATDFLLEAGVTQGITSAPNYLLLVLMTMFIA